MKKSASEPLSYVELSKDNIIHNIEVFRNFLGKNTKIVAAVKGNAYGHGQNEVASIMDPYVDYFFVNSALEFMSLRKVTKKPIFILGYVLPSDMLAVVKLRPILTFFSDKHLVFINNAAKKIGIIQEVHMPIDAFLGREGFLEKDWSNILDLCMSLKNIKLRGIYAHFANIEDTHNFTHARKQIKQFKRAVDLSHKKGFKDIKTHISATSGVLVYEKDKYLNHLVRIGIGAYGIWPSEHTEFLFGSKLKLLPVLSFKTKIAIVKKIPSGHTVGYGLTYTARKEMTIGVLPIGYADGIDRKLSNKGEVLVQGARCPIIGRISMNMTTIDLTHIETLVNEGDEVVFIGKQGTDEIKVEELAKWADTINYEVVTRLSSILPRIIK